MSKAKTKTYLFHEISSYLPLLEGEEFDALVEDIKEFGQIEHAVLYEGKIIDGRNRYRACKQLGIELKVREWNPSELIGMTPLQFVISENIMRRHLNTAQKSEVALLLLKEEEKLAKERMRKISEVKANIQNIEGKKDFQKISDENQKKSLEQEIKKIQNEMGSGSSKEIVGKKVKLGRETIRQAKKIKQVAEGYTDKEGIEYPPEPVIAEEWEKAKKGEQGVDAVYQKAKVVEEAKDLPKKEHDQVIREIQKGELPAKKIREIVKEKKETQEKLKIAEEKAKLKKEEKELKELYEKIEKCKDKIKGFENITKTAEVQLTVLSKEIAEKYPQWEKVEPTRLITELSLLYDSLDTNIYDNKLRDLKTEYDKLMNPLREKLEKLEKEYNEKKNEIAKQKSDVNAEIKWIEKYENLMGKEFEKIEFQKENINSAKDDLESMLKEYEEKYK